ncbi:hypothetical protein [Roseinatronobacter sp.]|uniref:hypothetical protein n=1 Tax=Roseinatronobacter sp. TaxID=1945755 RepID=UPI003F6F94D9
MIGANGFLLPDVPLEMSESSLTHMTDAAAAAIMDADQALDALPALLARRWPTAPALEMVLAISSACDAIERMYQVQGVSAGRVEQAWGIAALIGAQVYAAQRLNQPHATAADLCAFWYASSS